MKRVNSKQKTMNVQLAKTMRNSSQYTNESRSTQKEVPFTNEFIHKCIDGKENRKLTKIENETNQMKQKSEPLKQLLKINSINKSLKAFKWFEKNQQQKSKISSNSKYQSNIKNLYMKNASVTLHESKRPKSAIVTMSNSKPNQSAKYIDYQRSSQVKKCESDVLLKVVSLQDRLINKQNKFKEQISQNFNFFTSNLNVFMPLNKSRAYIGKSQLNSFKKTKKQTLKFNKTNQIKSTQSEIPYNLQKEFSQRCKQLLKSTITSNKQSRVHPEQNHSLIKKKADSSLHYQFLKQNKEGFIINKSQYKAQQFNNSFSREASISILHENMIQCNKNIQNQRKSLRKTKLLKSRTKELQRKKQQFKKTNQNFVEPSLYIQSVDVKMENKHRQQHYHSIHNLNSVDLFQIYLSNDHQNSKQNVVNKQKMRLSKDEYFKS